MTAEGFEGIEWARQTLSRCSLNKNSVVNVRRTQWLTAYLREGGSKRILISFNRKVNCDELLKKLKNDFEGELRRAAVSFSLECHSFISPSSKSKCFQSLLNLLWIPWPISFWSWRKPGSDCWELPLKAHRRRWNIRRSRRRNKGSDCMPSCRDRD